ncbi:MAG: SAM-dependent chlorinase/fluorinase [Candidatus Micrarchaeota archaeon]
MAAQTRRIGVLTDFGKDEAPYLLRSAIRRTNRDALIEDITHAIPKFNILCGAWRLRRVVSDHTQEQGSIYVAVVDPGVGGRRKNIIVETKTGKLLVGPDNGLLSLAFLEEGVERAIEIRNNEFTFVRQAASKTFAGRDVFAPVAGFLANGIRIQDFGPELKEDELTKIKLSCEFADNKRSGCLVDIDDFGTLRTNMPNHLAHEQLERPVQLKFSDSVSQNVFYETRVRLVLAFSELPIGELGILLSSTGCLDIAVNQGSAVEKLGIGFDRVGLDTGLVPITSVGLSF